MAEKAKTDTTKGKSAQSSESADAQSEQLQDEQAKDESVAVEAPKEAEAPQAPAEPPVLTFAPADLVARAPEYLGCPIHVAAGGLYGKTDPLSIADAQAQIESWLTTHVTEGLN